MSNCHQRLPSATATRNKPNKSISITHLRSERRPAVVRSDSVDQFVFVHLINARRSALRVALVVEQTERLLAVQRPTRKQIAVAHTELHLDVDAIRVSSLDERRPQPIVHILVRDVADHIGTPMNARLFEVCEALLHPLDVELGELLG